MASTHHRDARGLLRRALNKTSSIFTRASFSSLHTTIIIIPQESSLHILMI